MICPECGRETSNEQAFCKQCGAYIRSQFGKVLATGPLAPLPSATGPLIRRGEKASLEELEWDDIEKLLVAEERLWPTETIFALNTEEEADPPEDSPVSEFDDALADDDFEQSLSGRVKRKDLVAADEPLAKNNSGDGRFEGPIHVTATPETPATGVPTLDPLLKTNPDMFAGVLPQAQAEPAVERRSFRKTAISITAILIASSALFAGGVATGVRFADYAKYETPAETAVPPVSAEPPRIVPPAGMSYVPGGSFLMGSYDGDTISEPPHFKTVQPFFIDTTEVTNAEYAEFIKATGQVPPRSWKEGVYAEAEADFPVTGITWYEAAEYAAWKGKRLPTEAEWEFAARGTDGRTYPWGNEWDASLANAGETSKGLRPVGQGGVSPFGIYDMSGNAWEWTASDARSYPGGKEFPWSRMRLKVIRGGSWQSSERSATTYFRGYYGAAGEREYNGTSFRCVKDIAK